MSFENYPSTERNSEPVIMQPQNKWRNYLTAVLVIALLGTWSYIIWDKSRTKETIQKKDLVISNTSSQRDQLQKELEDATMLYDRIKTSSADMAHSKDSTISKRDREITEKRNKIQQLLSKIGATQEELEQAKGLIASLNGDIVGYKTQVETLQGEKLVLTKEKNFVIQERDKVQKNYDSATAVIKQKEEIIDIAATLHASNFSILGINERDNGKEKETTVAKRVDKLRISFDIDENRVAQSGSKNIFVCITGPNGKPLAVEAFGSGKFSTREGEEKYFTQKIDVNYTQGQRQTLSIDWKQNSDFETGDYKIEVYNNGFKIGEGIRSLKKGGLFG
jgi:peptidoglycan hydrolase CwlO-like protein